MGAGIAQVAAEGAAGRAVAAVRDRVARLVQKGRLEGPAVLDHGSLPLPVLGQVVADWAASAAAATT